MSVSTTARIKIRSASFSDYDQIAALQLRNGMRESSRECWEGLWRGNPACPNPDKQSPIGWVLETDAGEVVGFIGNLPLLFHFRGHELKAATGVGWAVDKAYRSYSMQLLHHFLRQNDVDLFPFATVNANAEPVLKLFKFERVPVGVWNKSAFWITNYHGFAASVMSMRSIRFDRAAGFLCAAAFFLWDTFRTFGRRDVRRMQAIEEQSEFDTRFDGFWEELKRQRHDTLLAVRTRSTLEWHFRESLSRQCCWVLTAIESMRLVAYAIFIRQDHPAIGLKRVRLVDFQSLMGFENTLRSFLSWSLRRCRQEHVHILEVMGCWPDRADLRTLPPPHTRTLSSWTYYYKAKDKALAAALQDSPSWAPSSFDGDASLYPMASLL